MIAPSDWNEDTPSDPSLPDPGRGARLQRVKQVLGVRAVLPLRAAFGSRAGNTFGILMYHRLANGLAGMPKPTRNVTPSRFREQMSGLLSLGYTPRRLRDVLDLARQGKPIPPKTFVVTFDDGYENNVTIARPILHKLKIPATIFVATSFLDSPRVLPCDNWSIKGSPDVAPGAWRAMTSEQCAELVADDLIDVGSHSHTHGDFRGRPADLRQDIETSLEILRTRFGQADATFAFPYGTHKLGHAGGDMAVAAREAGVLCALTTDGELVGPNADPYNWGRFTAEEDDTARTLAAKLDGWSTFARDLWRLWRGSKSPSSSPVTAADESLVAT